VIAVSVVAAVTALGAASSALASLNQDIQRFANCPVNTPGVSECVYSTTTGGEFILGKGAVPITKTVTIQGGLDVGKLVPASNGETLSKTALPVPGGLVGIELPGNFSEVTATAELAGQGEISSNIHLPLKVKLDNTLLGSGCYVGSEEEPLTLNLDYGTTNPPPPNKPISGKYTITTKDGGEILDINGTLVDNSFAAPGANGCTLLPLVGDLAVNTKEGLPAAAGTNTAIMSGNTEEISSQSVISARPLPDIGRCQKVEGVLEGKKRVPNGDYLNSSCTAQTSDKIGKYEWTEGAGPSRKFAGTGTKLTLETAGKSSVTCSASSNEGEYTGPKTETASFKLTGCAAGPKGKGAACQSSGAGSGEIQTAALEGGLGYIKENEAPETPIVGVDLKPTSGSNVATFECGGSPISLTGSVIAPITALDKMATSFKLKPAASGGVQSAQEFEGGSKDTLTFAPSGGSAEGAGLAGASTSSNEESLEIKAVL
jgi:hypothetical protein